MTELIDIPFLLTKDCSADLEDRLRFCIETGSLYQTHESFKKDIGEIVNTRQALVNLKFGDSKLLTKYYGYLECLLKKIDPEALAFSWSYTNYTIFEGNVFRDENLLGERRNILFNLGIAYYQSAKHIDDYKNNLPLVCDYLKRSAGCFEILSQRTKERNSEKAIISETMLKALKSMCMGLAQETVWFKSLAAKKDLLTSKLAYKCFEYFQESLNSFQLVGQSTEYIKLILVFVESKMLYFKAVCVYRLAQSIESIADNVGVVIRCLSIAVAALTNSKLESTVVFKNKCLEMLRQLEKDNDFIYLKHVPSHLQFSDFVKLYKLDSMKDLIVLPDLTEIAPSMLDQILFRNLLPIEIMDYGTSYNEKQDIYVLQHFVEPINLLNIQLDEELASFFEIDPQHIVNAHNKTKSFVTRKELDVIGQSFGDLESNAINIETQLANITSYLDLEIKTYEEDKQQYGDAWTIVDARDVTKEFYEKVEKLKQYLEIGRNINLETQELFASIDKSLVTSRTSKAHLTAQYNDPFLNKIEALKKRRERFISEIEKKSYENRIISKLIMYYKETDDIPGTISEREEIFDNIYSKHMKVFAVDMKYIEDCKNENYGLIKEIEEYKSRTNFNNEDRSSDPRTQYIQDVRQSLASLDDVKTQLKKVTAYYQQLIEKVNELVQVIVGFLEARRNDRERLLNEISIAA